MLSDKIRLWATAFHNCLEDMWRRPYTKPGVVTTVPRKNVLNHLLWNSRIMTETKAMLEAETVLRALCSGLPEPPPDVIERSVSQGMDEIGASYRDDLDKEAEMRVDDCYDDEYWMAYDDACSMSGSDGDADEDEDGDDEEEEEEEEEDAAGEEEVGMEGDRVAMEE